MHTGRVERASRRTVDFFILNTPNKQGGRDCPTWIV
nr:MAG TPA: biofilm formation protein [Caudoviricetes sp.]